MAPRHAPVAALALLLAAGALAAPAAAQSACARRLDAAVSACHGAIKAIIAGAGDAAAPGPACCAAAAGIFSGAFMAECGCDAGVLAIKATTSDAAVDAMRALTGAKCGVAAPAAYPACTAAAAAARVGVAAAPKEGGNNGTAPYSKDGSACYQTKCGTRKTCPLDRRNRTVRSYATKLTKAQNDVLLGACDFQAGNPAGIDVRMASKNNGTTVCQAAGTNGSGIVFDQNGCFVTCKPIGYLISNATTARYYPKFEMCKTAPGSGGCFPGDATAVVAGGAVKALRDLRVGDVVAAVKPDGAVTFAPVVFFDHQMDGGNNAFVRLSLTDGSALELSPGHFIPVGDKLASAVFKRASAVQAGNTVLVAPKGAVAAEPVLVDAVEMVTRSGMFAPVTTEGTVIIDGVVASSYSDWALDALYDALGWTDSLHRAYHAVHAPHRALYRAFGAKLMAKLTPILSGLGMLDAAQIATVFTAKAASA